MGHYTHVSKIDLLVLCKLIHNQFNVFCVNRTYMHVSFTYFYPYSVISSLFFRRVHTAIEPDLDWMHFDWNKFQPSLIVSALWVCDVNLDNEIWVPPWLSHVIIIRQLIHLKRSCSACCCCIRSFAWYSEGTRWEESTWTGDAAEKIVVIAHESGE